MHQIGSNLDNQNTAVSATGMLMFGTTAIHNETYLSETPMAYGAASFSYYAGPNPQGVSMLDQIYTSNNERGFSFNFKRRSANLMMMEGQ